jgi:hypothetical protein
MRILTFVSCLLNSVLDMYGHGFRATTKGTESNEER